MNGARYLLVAIIITAGCFFCAVPPVYVVAAVLYITPIIWIMRSLVAKRTGPILDGIVCICSVLIFLWSYPVGVIVALWLFLLTQGLVEFLPSRRARAPKCSGDRFENAQRCAQQSLIRLLAR